MTLSNATKAAAYRDMLDLINTRHIKGALEDAQGGVCLVGAANRAVAHLGDQERLAASAELQRDVLAGILDRSPLLRVAMNNPRMQLESHDGGLAAIEIWNDLPWRRTRAVVKILEDLAHTYGDRAREDLIVELTATVTELRAQQAQLKERIAQLEAENARLSEEVAFWKSAWQGHRARVSAKQLRNASDQLADLDDHLNRVLADLEETAAPAEPASHR